MPPSYSGLQDGLYKLDLGGFLYLAIDPLSVSEHEDSHMYMYAAKLLT